MAIHFSALRHFTLTVLSGEVNSVKEIAAKEEVFDTEITRVLPLAFLAIFLRAPSL